MSRWVGKFPSLKLNRMVGYQSLIERDFIYLLDFNPGVRTYCEQPVSIYYTTDGKRRRYTPDFSLTYRQRKLLVECKHHQFMQIAENEPKWHAASDWCSAHATTFHVVTEQMIRRGYYLTNVKRLTAAARYPISVTTKATALSLLKAHSQLSLGQLASQLNQQAPTTAITTILHLAYHQLLWLPLFVPITPQSIITQSDHCQQKEDLLTLLT